MIVSPNTDGASGPVGTWRRRACFFTILARMHASQCVFLGRCVRRCRMDFASSGVFWKIMGLFASASTGGLFTAVEAPRLGGSERIWTGPGEAGAFPPPINSDDPANRALFAGGLGGDPGAAATIAARSAQEGSRWLR